MLPSRPNAPRSGIHPPSARSRSIGRSREDAHTQDRESETPRRRAPSSSRSVRPQRSVADLPSHSSYGERDSHSSRGVVPPMPKAPRARSVAPGRDRDRDDTRSVYTSRASDSASSRSSISSNGSSFLDRMKSRPGYASSRTSLEDEGEPYPLKRGREAGTRPVMAKNAVNEAVRRGYQDEPDVEDDTQASGFGSSLWSRVATAAGLTVNVGKAWASNVTTFAGEETPEGQESRLTRAMKAYHLEKAQDPSDLPEWLFDEHERRPARSRFASSSGEIRDSSRNVGAQSRGLRDVYEAAVASTVVARSERSDLGSGRRYGSDSGTSASKATDRLKAMRDAKRSAGTRPTDSASSHGREDTRVSERPSARVGLPSGPGVRPRRQ